MLNKIKKTGLCWLWITVIILILDRITKISIQHYLVLGDSISVIPFFNLTLAYNTGAAFSLLDSASGWQIWVLGSIAAIVSVSILIWLSRLTAAHYRLDIALTLVLGGALGNLWDRLSYGHVIDFLDFYVSYYHWPAFNIADSAICLGAILLLLDSVALSPPLKKGD